MALVVRGVSQHFKLQGGFSMITETVKNALYDTIQELTDCKWRFSAKPGKDFTRSRKFPFQKMISSILAFRGGTLNHEIMDFFGLDASIGTSSAFIQQRAKILPEAFECLFRHFTSKVDENKLYHGFRLLAVDGSDLQIARNPNDPDSFFPGSNGQKAYNLLHINAMYDLLQHIYMDAIVQKRKCADESGALTSMVDRSDIQNALLLADRGYESYNNLAHMQEKGWNYLIRIKDNTSGIASGLSLPKTDTFDVPFYLRITKRKTNAVAELLKDRNHYRFLPATSRFDYLPQTAKKHGPVVFYDLHFRIVRFPISDTMCETIITNLDAELFPLAEIKRLYAMRWGIETSFRDLKYTLGLLHLHAKKVEFVLQEIFAKLTMYNFCELITQSVVIQQKQKKYTYKVNFSDAAHVCFEFFLGNVPPPDVEALLMRYISPIRPGRKNTRKLTLKVTFGFTYRIA
jgi:hypothetical protein